jgi:hypothetical protein
MTMLANQEQYDYENYYNSLDIADALKELLQINAISLRKLLKMDAEDLARVIGIDPYVAKLIIVAAKQYHNNNSADLIGT